MSAQSGAEAHGLATMRVQPPQRPSKGESAATHARHKSAFGSLIAAEILAHARRVIRGGKTRLEAVHIAADLDAACSTWAQLAERTAGLRL